MANSPDIGAFSAFTFAELPTPTATQLIADVNPQNVSSPVTFTAYVQAASGVTCPTGP